MSGGNGMRSRGWRVRGGGATILVALGLTLLSGSSRAAENYTATANARLIGIDFTVTPPIAFDQLIDVGVSAAQAQIDSLGTTRAFASSPYPSNSVVLLPGLVAGLSAGATSDLVPEYPLIASTNETTASDHKELGTLVLDAQSTSGSSRGTVTDGATRAIAHTTADDDLVVARAETTVSSLQLTPLLSLDGIRTTAEARRTPGGDIDLSSSFEVAAITILGQRVALTPKSLSLLGTDVPLGLDLSGVLGQLLVALADQGTTITFIPASRTEDGITAAGLRIDSVFDAPPEVASGLQDVRAAVTLGLASVSVSNQALGQIDDGATDVALPGDGQVVPSFDADLPGAGPALPGDQGASPPPVARPAATAHPLPVDTSLSGLYPVLVLAAALGVGLVNLIRHLGVRSP